MPLRHSQPPGTQPCSRIIAAKPSYLTHYCIVRADIPHGAQAAQLIHAAGESSPGNLPESTYAIALSAKDEPELRAVAAKLTEAGFPLTLAIESDEPYTGQAMAIGIAPTDRGALKKYLSSLPLLR